MELGRKGNATILGTIQSKTLDHHSHQHTIIKPQAISTRDPCPYPDLELDNDPDPDPTPVSTSPPTVLAKKAATRRQKRTRGQHTAARYGECQRNHAAAAGGHVVDGCCEFMPSGQDGTPEALKCAACECHRSFHRKEMDGQDLSTSHLYDHNTNNKHQIAPAFYYSSYNILPSHATHPTAEISRKSSPSEDISQRFLHQNHHYLYSGSDIVRKSEKGMKKKKRFRTKISQEQKEKMREFAEKLGWRMQKKDEEEVDKFCSQVNLKRQVFKVWMHNNKQATKRINNLEK